MHKVAGSGTVSTGDGKGERRKTSTSALCIELVQKTVNLKSPK